MCPTDDRDTRAASTPGRTQLDAGLRRAVVALERIELRHGLRWLLLCAMVGAVAGLGALLFDFLSRLAVHGFLERLAGWQPVLPAGEQHLLSYEPGARRLWVLLFLPALGGLLGGALVRWLAPEAAGHGTDAAIDAYHRRAGYIRPLVPLVKIVASALTLGSGGSGGREGPIAQAGAGWGAFVATRLRLSNDERRILMAAGLGAGIGSIFRAPARPQSCSAMRTALCGPRPPPRRGGSRARRERMEARAGPVRATSAPEAREAAYPETTVEAEARDDGGGRGTRRRWRPRHESRAGRAGQTLPMLYCAA